MSKTEEIKIRVTPDFKRAFKLKASELGLSMSSLVVKSYSKIDSKISRKITVQTDPKLILEVAKIGGNLNQISRNLNIANKADALDEVDFREILFSLKSIENILENLKNDK